MFSSADASVTERSLLEIMTVTSAGYSIVDEELHDDTVARLGPVRDVLASGSVPFTVASDSSEGTATIASRMAGLSSAALISAVVTNSKEETVSPFHWLQRFLVFESPDSFIDGGDSLLSSHAHGTASIDLRAGRKAFLLLLKIFDEVGRVSSQFVLGCPDLLVERSDDIAW